MLAAGTARTGARASPRPITPVSRRRAPAARRAARGHLGQPEHPRQRRDGRADRGPGLADRLPAPAVRARAQPVEPVWSHLKRSLANLAKRNLSQLTALVKTRLRRMQYRPGLLEGFLASTGLDLAPFCNPRNEECLVQASGAVPACGR